MLLLDTLIFFQKMLLSIYKTTPFNSPFVKGDLMETTSFKDSPLKKGVSAIADRGCN